MLKNLFEKFYRTITGVLDTSGDSLLNRSISSGAWKGLTRFMIRSTGLLQTLLVAWFLTPEIYGLFVILVVILQTFEEFSKTGVKQTLIQRQSTSPEMMNTAWLIEAGRGIVLASILIVLAPWIGDYFEAAELILPLKILALVPLMDGFKNVGVVQFEQDLEFKSYFAYQALSTLLAFPVVAVLIIVLRNVWALVAMMILESFLRFVFSYYLHPFRPGLSFSKKSTRSLWSFGRWIFSNKIIRFLITKGDDLFVAKFLGPLYLGFYRLAYRFSQLPQSEVTNVISPVTYPLLSKLVDKPEQFKNAWLRSLHATVLWSFPLSALIYLFAPEFVELILGEQWIPAIVPLQIMVFIGLLRSINYDSVFKAADKPYIITRILLGRLLVILGLIYPMTTRFGMEGTAFCILLSTAVVEPWGLYRTLQITGASIGEFLTTLTQPAVATVIMIGFVVSLKTIVPSTVISFIVFAGVAGIGYILLSFVIDRFTRKAYLRRLYNDTFKNG